MKVAVITPYYKEPVAQLLRAHDSVMGQSLTCDHIFVADGFPLNHIDSLRCQHIKLPQSHGDAGNFARGLGGLQALNAGYEYVAYLDADNWYEPDHVNELVAAGKKERCLVATSARKMIRSDGSVRIDGDDHCDGKRMADTSTLLLHRDAYGLIAFWSLLPTEAAFMGDVLLWAAIQSRRYATTHTGLQSLNYQMRAYTQTEWDSEQSKRARVSENFEKKFGIEERKRLILGFRQLSSTQSPISMGSS